MAYQEVDNNSIFHSPLSLIETNETASAVSTTPGGTDPRIITVLKGQDASFPGTDSIYIRVDGSGEENICPFYPEFAAIGAIQPGLTLKGNNLDGGWLLGYADSSVFSWKIRRYNSDGITRDISEVITGINILGGTHRCGMDVDDAGRITIAGIKDVLGSPQNEIWFERYQDSISPTLGSPYVQTTVPHVVGDWTQIGPIKVVCHKQSGRFTIAFVDRQSDPTVLVWRYDDTGSPIGSPIIVDSIPAFTGFNFSDNLQIISQYGNDGFVILYESTGGLGASIINCQEYDSNGVLIYTTQIQGPGNPGEGVFPQRWAATICADPCSVQTKFSYAIRFLGYDFASFPGGPTTEQIFIIEGTTGDVLDSFLVPVSDTSIPTIAALSALNEHEIRSISNELATDGLLGQQTFVTNSIQMSLWKRNRDAYLYSDPSPLDAQANTYVYSLFPGAFLRNDSESEFESDHNMSNAESNTFSGPGGLLGSPSSPIDTIFIGGPITSEIVSLSLNALPEHLANVLYPQFPVNGLSFLTDNDRKDGFSAGTFAPAIQVSNAFGSFILERHLPATSSFSVPKEENTRPIIIPIPIVHTIIDYAMIIRVPVNPTDNHEGQSIIYIGGINEIGTRAAAWCLKNYSRFRIGMSQAVIVQLEYEIFQNPSTYDPSLANQTPVNSNAGIIKVIDAGMINANNYEA